MWSSLLQPHQSPKSLELISNPCSAPITNGSRQSRSVQQSTSVHRGRPNRLQQTLSTHWAKEAQKCFAHQYCDQNKRHVTRITLWNWSFGDFPCSSVRQQIKITWMTPGSTKHWSQWLQQFIPLSITYIRQTSTCRSLCKQYPETGPSVWP